MAHSLAPSVPPSLARRENEHELHERDERRETEAKLPRFDMCGVRGIKNELCQRKRPHVRKEEGKRAVQGMRLRVP